MYELAIQKEVFASDADMSGTGDQGTFTPPFPCEIVGFGYVITTVVTDAAGGLVLKADKRPTAGSDSGRGDGDGGVLTLTNAQAILLTAGKVMLSRPNTPLIVYPGEQIVLDLTTAPDGGAGLPFILYKHKPRTDDTDITIVTA